MAPILKPAKMPTLRTTLRVDAMYLHAARASFRRALKQEIQVGKAWRRIARLNARRDHILEKHNGDAMAGYDELEPIYIQMEGAEYMVGAA
jgi:hypothetical protein